MKDYNMSTWQSSSVLSTMAEWLQSSVNTVLFWTVVPLFSIWCLYYGWLLLQYCGRKVLSRLVEMREDMKTESRCDHDKEEARGGTAPTVHDLTPWKHETLNIAYDAMDEGVHHLYGCTFHSCDITFLEKGQWIRHEMTTHEQMECWLCDNPTCGRKLFYDRSSFTKHLEESHHVADINQMKHLCNIQHIGLRSRNQYWCGFCRKIVSMIAIGVEGDSERFNHISHHVVEEKRSMSKWERLEGSLDYK